MEAFYIYVPVSTPPLLLSLCGSLKMCVISLAHSVMVIAHLHLSEFTCFTLVKTLLGASCWYFCFESLILWGTESARCLKLSSFSPYLHDRITQFLQICWLLIHHVNLLFYQIQKVLQWIGICWLWKPFEYNELIVMLEKSDGLNFVTRCLFLLGAGIRRDVVSNSSGRRWH